jgi:hypothetical protein
MTGITILKIKGANVQAAVGPQGSMVPGYAVRLRDVYKAAAAREVSATAILAEAFKGINTMDIDHLVGPVHDLWLFRRTP